MISDAKIKDGLFVGLEVRKLIQVVKFEDWLIELDKAAWKSFKNVPTAFWEEIIQKKTVVIWWLI